MNIPYESLEAIEALKHENSLLRDLVLASEPDREAKEHYERTLQEIGRLIGCDHIGDDRFTSCVTEYIMKGDDAIRALTQIVRRNGVTESGVKNIEDFLKTCGVRTRQG